MWVRKCRGKFLCASHTVLCGWPPGLPAYNCSCVLPVTAAVAAPEFLPQAPTPRSMPRSRPLTLVLGMPRAGTHSLHEFFQCSGWTSTHWIGCGAGNATAQPRPCAYCVLDWLKTFGNVPFRTDYEKDFRAQCGEANVHTEFSHINTAMHAHTAACLFPQVQHLGLLVSALPGACFILNTRPVEHWLRSVEKWLGGGLFINLGRYCVQGGRLDRAWKVLKQRMPKDPSQSRGWARIKQNATAVRLRREEHRRASAAFNAQDASFRAIVREGLRAWYLEHLEAAREVLKGHKCMIEVDIESPAAARLLTRRFPTTNKSCWGRSSLTMAGSRGRALPPRNASRTGGLSSAAFPSKRGNFTIGRTVYQVYR